MYLTSMAGVEERGAPSLVQVTWGSGSPFTVTLSSMAEPSATLCSGLRPVTKLGGHMRESSGGRASSLVAERERVPPLLAAESERR